MKENNSIAFTAIQISSPKEAKSSPHTSIFRSQLLLFLVTFMANASIHMIRVAWSVLKPEIRDVSSMDVSTLGFIDSLFLLSYAVGLILNGQLGDKYARKNVIFFGLLITAVAAICVRL